MDRITRVRIKNVRALKHVDLELGRPLTVLIGENGAGKSTIIECAELLRKAAEPSFMQQVYQVHRGMPGLLRKGAAELELGLVVEDDDGTLPRIEYALGLAPQGAGAVIQHERILVHAGPGQPLRALDRRRGRGEIFDQKAGKPVPIPPEALRPDQPVIASFGNLPPQKAIERLLAVMRGIEVHLGFDTLAAWAAQSVQRAPTLRGTGMLVPAERLSLLGHNLASAWSALKNVDDAHWRQTMALVRLGLGDSIDSINTVPDAGGGYVGLSLRRTDLPDAIPAANLSDGQLSWLAFIALARLNPGRSFLAIDEPELHLHPSLLGRVVSLLSSLDGGAPVLLSTHADRVLELLDDPAGAVRVCSLEGSEAVVSRIDPAELPRWLDQFGDLGQLRASGYLKRVLAPTSDAAPAPGEGDE